MEELQYYSRSENLPFEFLVCSEYSVQMFFWSKILNFPKYLEYVNRHKDFDAFEKSLQELILLKQKRAIESFLISSENLCSPPFLYGSKIHEIFKGLFERHKVIIYIRKQDDYIISAWKQWWHKRGHSLDDRVRLALKGGAPDFKKMADCFVKIYGKSSVQINPIQKEFLVGQDLFLDFCDKAGIKLAEDHNSAEKRNESGNFYLYEIFHRLSHIYGKKDSGNAVIRDLKHSVSDKNNILKVSSYPVLSNAIRRQIMDRFYSDNVYLHQEFFRHLDFDSIYPPLVDDKKNDVQILKEEVENLKDIVALQMEMLLESRRRSRRVRDKVKRALRHLGLSHLVGVYFNLGKWIRKFW